MLKQYSDLICPECEEKGEFEIDSNYEVYCSHCGLVIESPYPYSAGVRFKTLSYILIDKEIEEMKENEKL